MDSQQHPACTSVLVNSATHRRRTAAEKWADVVSEIFCCLPRDFVADHLAARAGFVWNASPSPIRYMLLWVMVPIVMDGQNISIGVMCDGIIFDRTNEWVGHNKSLGNCTLHAYNLELERTTCLVLYVNMSFLYAIAKYNCWYQIEESRRQLLHIKQWMYKVMNNFESIVLSLGPTKAIEKIVYFFPTSIS